MFKNIELIDDVSLGQRGFNRNIHRLAKKFGNTFKSEFKALADKSVARAAETHKLEKSKGLFKLVAQGFVHGQAAGQMKGG
jgi:hypothetical protein